MKKYKIYKKGNYIVVTDNITSETFYGRAKDVMVDKNNTNRAAYRFFNILDLKEGKGLTIDQILKEDGSPYTSDEFDTFYTQNTGNFNGGGTAPIIDLISTDSDNSIELGSDEKLWSGGGSTPDATTTVKGKLKLAGDLAGTADLPTVPNKVDKNTAISAATKTKITYDSKGLVTEGADALTSDITDSVNRRYVTDAQLVVIGNTSGTNTGDQDLSALESKTVQTTGSVISFSTRQRYNSIASPTSENITDNLTGARIGVVQKIFSNRGTTPTFPSGWVKRGAGNYIPSTLNIIYAEWEEGTTVSYWITQ